MPHIVRIEVDGHVEEFPEEMFHDEGHAIVIGDHHGKLVSYPYVSHRRVGDRKTQFHGPEHDFTVEHDYQNGPGDLDLDDDDIDYSLRRD